LAKHLTQKTNFVSKEVPRWGLTLSRSLNTNEGTPTSSDRPASIEPRASWYYQSALSSMSYCVFFCSEYFPFFETALPHWPFVSLLCSCSQGWYGMMEHEFRQGAFEAGFYLAAAERKRLIRRRSVIREPVDVLDVSRG
jgi:hypothetical protein